MNSKKPQVSRQTDASLKTLATFSLVVVSAGYVLLSIAARLLNEGFGPFTQVYARLSIALLASIILFYKALRWSKFTTIPKRDWIGLLLMGIVGYGIYVYFITIGALYANLLNVAVVLAASPFLSYFYSYLIFREKLKPIQILLLVATIVGVAIVGTKSFIPNIASFGKGEMYVLFSAFCGPWFFVGRRMLSKHLNNSEITVIVMAIAFLVTFLAAIWKREPFHIGAFSNWHVLVGLAIGAFFNIFSTDSLS